MEEKILTLHPDPNKQGVRISKMKYEAVAAAILNALRPKAALTLAELTQEVKQRLKNDFQGSLNWYVVTVKLDLEARQALVRTPGTPHRVHLPEKAAELRQPSSS